MLVLVMLFGMAHAAPGDRVVLADPDPELLRAVTSTLAPWRFEVVVDPDPPASTSDAQRRAEQRGARFVVWRREGDLVVYDRARGAAEHREGRLGALDPIDAAAAALTVKTLMRLPLPNAPDTVADDRGAHVRLLAGLGVRFSAPGTAARFIGLASIRPWSSGGWGFGIGGDLGTATDLQQAGFRGSWSDWSLVAVASWLHEIGAWQVEPFVAVGAVHSALSGTAMKEVAEDSDLIGTVRGGVLGSFHLGRWSLGISLAIEGVTSTPTYTRDGASAEIFEVPAVAVTSCVFVSTTLGL